MQVPTCLYNSSSVIKIIQCPQAEPFALMYHLKPMITSKQVWYVRFDHILDVWDRRERVPYSHPVGAVEIAASQWTPVIADDYPIWVQHRNYFEHKHVAQQLHINTYRHCRYFWTCLPFWSPYRMMQLMPWKVCGIISNGSGVTVLTNEQTDRQTDITENNTTLAVRVVTIIYLSLFAAAEQEVKEAFHHPAGVCFTRMNACTQHHRFTLLHYHTLYICKNKKVQQSWQTSALAMHLPLARLVSTPIIFCLLPSSSIVILVFYLFSTDQWTARVITVSVNTVHLFGASSSGNANE